jgi:phosphoribosyl-ATP pyrophosphohydrolase/phosphoribosyl-AMP cyclohydrolase
MTTDCKNIDWDKSDGLVPAVIQDANSLHVLMLGYLNRDALQRTIETGLVTFFSRSKNRLWQKGETSGHILRVRNIELDCDNDTFLIMVDPQGPTCHMGTRTCFGDAENANVSVIADLAATIQQRHVAPLAESYTTKLFSEGITRIAQKVGEEGVETALAAATHDPQLASEAADLIYHLLVLLEASDTTLVEVFRILRQRAKAKK